MKEGAGETWEWARSSSVRGRGVIHSVHETEMRDQALVVHFPSADGSFLLEGLTFYRQTEVPLGSGRD